MLWPILVSAPSFHNSDSIAPDYNADKSKAGAFFKAEDRLLNKTDFRLVGAQFGLASRVTLR